MNSNQYDSPNRICISCWTLLVVTEIFNHNFSLTWTQGTIHSVPMYARGKGGFMRIRKGTTRRRGEGSHKNVRVSRLVVWIYYGHIGDLVFEITPIENSIVHVHTGEGLLDCMLVHTNVWRGGGWKSRKICAYIILKGWSPPDSDCSLPFLVCSHRGFHKLIVCWVCWLTYLRNVGC